MPCHRRRLGRARPPSRRRRARARRLRRLEHAERNREAGRCRHHRRRPAQRRGRLTANAPLVVISRNADRTAVDDALAAGATGFVPEADVEHRLAATVRAVAVGQLAIPNEHRAAVAHPILSPREKQVMSMVVLGFTNVEIASKLHVTETTVKSHLSSAYRKLRVRSRQEATALILSNKDLGLGILTLAGDRGVS